ncbi:hypothetical protein KGF54_003041 [Candida jiufengensis]|uniref:uncharacterized protein n=1 Tax=Candida jiufengensis TaxID=497108 RepID=UPI00222407A7|nr:uncharacterized protein KGF54_003041 [Candida jiufengensis]KAI5953669.1 hypothetical protein KGF54_003041 [Candida jiufengensis]
MKKTGELLIGESQSQMIKPQNIVQIFSSPRKRARHTLELILEAVPPKIREKIPVEYDDDLTEWNYGRYEGLKTAEIRKSRHDRGIDPPDHDWSIWSDGCEDGEDYKQVTERLDRFIKKVKSIHVKALNDGQPSDIIVVAHGHILRCLVARWVGRDLNVDPALMLDAGGVGVLSYQHHNINEPSIYMAGAFRVPVEEKGADI